MGNMANISTGTLKATATQKRRDMSTSSVSWSASSRWITGDFRDEFPPQGPHRIKVDYRMGGFTPERCCVVAGLPAKMAGLGRWNVPANSVIK
jgi:hypothetical protein